MNITTLSRTGVALALSALMASLVAPVQAAETTGSPLFPSLSLTPAIKDRMFMRMSYVYSFTKTKSEAARDITGPVVKIADLNAMYQALPAGNNAGTLAQRMEFRKKANYNSAIDALDGALNNGDISSDSGFPTGALGTPNGIKARAGDAGTMAFSLGYFLDDSYTWAVEALLLGAPLNISVYGDGINDTGTPNGVNGKKIITTKMLPPMALFGRYFGSKESTIRPYLGIGAMYAIFFDTKATSFFNSYQGGETSVSNKNSFGIGPFAGLQANLRSGWHVGLNLGYVKLKTEATLVTKGTMITSNSGVLGDYSADVLDAISVGTQLNNVSVSGTSLYNGEFTTQLMKDLAAYKATTQGGGGDGTLGTYVRKQKNTFDNTIMMLSVARDF